MTDRSKSKQELIQELASLRKRIAELEQSELEHKRAEKTLREAERLQRLIFEHSSDVIYILDGDLRVTSVSTSVERHLGYRTEELVGRHFNDLNVLAPESLEAAFKDALQALAGDIVPATEYVFIRKDGTRVIGEVSGSPLVEDGKIVGLISVARDITERKRAEEALRESEKRVRRKLDTILSPEADIGALKLSDIIDSEKIQKLMDEFYQLTNIGIGIIDLHGRVLVGTGWQDICTKFHRINPESCRLCIESDLELSCNVPVGTFKQYRCKNSMWDIATPIMLGDRHVGNIFLGQFLFDDETPDYETFRQQACRYGFNEQEYIEALDWVPRWSREKVNSTMTFYTAFAGMIGNLSYSNVKLAHALEERKRTEEELSRVNRALQMLSNTNQALMHITDEATLLNKICKIAVDVGGYRLAWVGFAEHDEAKTLRPVAHAGFDSGYIESAKITWADNERGRGPGGAAVRTGQPCIVRNIPEDPSFAPWREEATRRGYKSIIALPLTIESQTFGAMGIYSVEADVFNVKEVEILKELAADLAFGITVLHTRAKRDLAEEALRYSEKEKTILNQIANVFLTIPDEEMYGEVLNVVLRVMNSNFGIFGYIGGNGDLVLPSLTRDIWRECQVPGKSIVFPADSWGESLWGRAIREKRAFYSDGPFRTPEGHVHVDHFLAAPVVFGQKTIGLISVANKEGGYTHEDKILLERITGYISPILNARLQRDMQEQKRGLAVEDLRKSEEKYRGVVENIGIGIAVINTNMEILALNNQMKEWFPKIDVSKYPACYKAFNDPPGETVCAYCPADKTIEDGRVHESITKKPAGNETRNYRVVSSPLRDNDGKINAAIVMIEDITERIRIERELLKADKLESVGLLAGGIAHDFNNILTSISGNISMAKMQVEPSHKIFNLLSAAEKASVRAQGLTRQLLTFAKGGMPIKETASIKDLIKESFLFVLRGSKSEYEYQIPEDLWPVEADLGQISQVISNIAINANQAMPEGGIIRIEAENMMPEKMNDIPVKSGRYIRISIKDQGVGIDEKHLSKIFDPYFTTKQAGSGLGLATAYSIINKHNGYISVDSPPGEGTTFHIYLPASDKGVPVKEEAVLLQGCGRILVMDDDKILRELAKEMLAMLGYESEFARDGDEAIEMYRKAMGSEKPYDAVILDLTIPGGMGGQEVVKILLKTDPEVKAIVFSGYAEGEVMTNYREYGFKGMIPKPFDAYALGKVLNDVLKDSKSIKET